MLRGRPELDEISLVVVVVVVVEVVAFVVIFEEAEVEVADSVELCGSSPLDEVAEETEEEVSPTLERLV